MLPEFTDDSLLPVGIYESTIDEVSEVFGSFQRSDQRIQLVQRLRSFLNELWEANVAEANSMISTVQDFEHVQSQLVRVERALAALRRDVLPVNPAQYQLMSESYVEMWQKLRAELNNYLGLAETSSDEIEAAPAMARPESRADHG